MNQTSAGIILVFLLALMIAPVCGNSATGTEETDFTLDVYYSGTVTIAYLIDNSYDSYRQFNDLVQGRESYDLGKGRNIKVTVYKGRPKFNIDYLKMTALLFADGKQIAGGTTLDKSGKVKLAYEFK